MKGTTVGAFHVPQAINSIHITIYSQYYYATFMMRKLMLQNAILLTRDTKLISEPRSDFSTHALHPYPILSLGLITLKLLNLPRV